MRRAGVERGYVILTLLLVTVIAASAGIYIKQNVNFNSESTTTMTITNQETIPMTETVTATATQTITATMNNGIITTLSIPATTIIKTITSVASSTTTTTSQVSSTSVGIKSYALDLLNPSYTVSVGQNWCASLNGSQITDGYVGPASGYGNLTIAEQNAQKYAFSYQRSVIVTGQGNCIAYAIISPDGSGDILIKSARLIFTGGALNFIITNNGQVATRTIKPLSTCSPDLFQCEYINDSGFTFVLQPNSSFNETLSTNSNLFAPYIPKSTSSCDGCLPNTPIAGQFYFFKLQLLLSNGNTTDLNVAAEATGNYPLSSNPSTAQEITVSPQGYLNPQLQIFGNQSGKMSIGISLYLLPLTATITANLLGNVSYYISNGVMNTRTPIISASVNYICTNSTCPGIGGNAPAYLILSTNFSTVTTGITVGPYYLISISIQDTHSALYGNYVFWMNQANNYHPLCLPIPTGPPITGANC